MIDFVRFLTEQSVYRRTLFIFILFMTTLGAQAASPAIEGSFITGLFYTNQTPKQGWVLPWRLVIKPEWKSGDTTLRIDLENQTGIIQGPYIDGFTSQKEALNIRKAIIKHLYHDTQLIGIGFGRVKANFMKNAGSRTPLPFSAALSQPVLRSADIALSWTPSKSINLGYSVSNISNQTQPETGRQNNLFIEWQHKWANTTLWAQLLSNQINTVFDTADYFASGINQRIDYFELSTAITIDKELEVSGFDSGIRYQADSPLLKEIGLGYALSRSIQNTVELSTKIAFVKGAIVTTSIYWQKPVQKTGSISYGSKIEYPLPL